MPAKDKEDRRKLTGLFRYCQVYHIRPQPDEELVASVVMERLARRQMRSLPQELRGSLTWDRGMEMADHKTLTLATDLKVYFCDPRSPWQRGSNENTNKLLRQYLPKKTDLSLHSQAELDRIATRSNQRPRKTLKFSTPAENLRRSVASMD